MERGLPSHLFFRGSLLPPKPRKECWFYSPQKQLALDYAFEYIPDCSLLLALGLGPLVTCVSGGQLIEAAWL